MICVNLTIKNLSELCLKCNSRTASLFMFIMAVDVLFKLKVIAESAEFKVSLKSTVFCNSHQSVLCSLRPIKLHSIQEHSLGEGLFNTFLFKNRAIK